METLLVCSKDGYIVPLNVSCGNAAEKARKKLHLENYYKQLDYNSIITKYNDCAANQSSFGADERQSLEALDCENLNFLAEELKDFSFVKHPETFSNKVERNDFPPDIAAKSNTVHFDYRIPNDKIPAYVKELGYRIEPADKVYPVVYNQQKGIYEAENFDLNKARVSSGSKKITWVRNHFTFSPSDYNELKTMISRFTAEQRNNPQLNPLDFAGRISDAKKRSLFYFYANEYNNNRTAPLIFLHEVKHIKNKVVESGLSLHNDARRLSVEDYHILQVEDERSAYLSQVVNAVNEYQKKGDFSDFSMFDKEARYLVDKLKSLPESERSKFAGNLEQITACAFKSFASEHEQHYAGQFKTNLAIAVNNAPLSAEDDFDRREFKKLRGAFYNFEIYNPQTKQLEHKNLSQYITPDREVSITPDFRHDVIEPNKARMQSRLQKYRQDIASGKINKDLVAPAKKIKLDKFHVAQFIDEIDGISVSQVHEQQQKEENSHEPPPAWSKELKNYWQKFDGYEEIANNKNEYAFRLHNDTVSYKSQNKVSISGDAEYETYKKLLSEPTNKNKAVRFKDDLTEEQALKLYIACINSGRKMRGAVPTNLEKIKLLKNIPAAEMNKFNYRMNAGQNNPQNGRQSLPQQRIAAAEQTRLQGGR